MNLKQLCLGLATCMPGLKNLRVRGTGGTTFARYCYSIWLRHLVMAKENGLNTNPRIVAELGPGDSLGIGLAALISGCEKYYAFDIVEFSNLERNIKVFDEIVELFKKKEAIPNTDFPRAKPRLSNYDFPSDIFDDKRLQKALDDGRLEKIRDSICNNGDNSSMIQYKAPWYETSVLEEETADLIYSQAVLEHIDELKSAYKSMWLWLKTTGYISHQIDFKCHGTANEWNGHWGFSDFIWKMFRGRRPYLINRFPHSTHISLLHEEKFKVVCDKTVTSESNLTRNDLAPKYKSMSDEDLSISGTFIQATKVSEVI
jgi:hypothetical protein